MMNASEIQSIIERVKNIWPKRFNDDQIDIIIEGLNAFSFTDAMEAVKDCAIDVGFVGPGDIVTRARVIASEKARVTKTKKEVAAGCKECINGHVFAMQDGYEYAFQCSCAYDPSKPVPVWDVSFTKQGFTRKPIRPNPDEKLVERSTENVACKKCGTSVGETHRIKINYK